MRGANIVAAILLSGALGACGFAQAAPGPAEVITKGAQPFSETWQDMARRDAATHAVTGLGPVARVVRETPLHVQRMPSPGLSALAQEAPFPEPGPLAPQAVGTSFVTVNLQDQFNAFGSGSIPPDTMGAVGPSHFVQVINSSVAVYNKTGARLSHVSLDSFFTVTVGGTTYPGAARSIRACSTIAAAATGSRALWSVGTPARRTTTSSLPSAARAIPRPARGTST